MLISIVIYYTINIIDQVTNNNYLFQITNGHQHVSLNYRTTQQANSKSDNEAKTTAINNSR